MSSWSVHLAAAACSVLAALLYVNTLKAGLVFDDQAAILTNKDLLPSSPWSNLLFHDFWGDNIQHTSSHKSFRPITSVSFKLNYHIHGDQPMHYHSVNVLLNAVVCYLFVMIAHFVLNMELGLAALAGILYTIHPLHTEAVAGVVGRAELLSAIFFMLTIFAYQRATKSKQVGWLWLLLSMLTSLCSMFSKEQGISVVAACISYETFIVLKFSLSGGVYLVRSVLFRPNEVPRKHWHFLVRTCTMLMFLIVVMGLRISLMDGVPNFSKSDNPGQRLATPLRQAYYWHLIFANVWLFLCPSKLRHDWRFGPVPLFSSLSDTRNIWTAITFIAIITLGLSSMKKRSKFAMITNFSFWLAVITFLPSSNLFFLVGFVLAERVLYLPTMGACILIAVGLWRILSYDKISRFYKILAKLATLCLIVTQSVKTVHRNQVWESGFNLYVDALKLYPTDGLMFSNLGYDMGHRNNVHLAEECHVMAVKMAPRYSQPFRNYGSFLQSQERYSEAEKMYKEAIRILGQGPRSKRSRRAATYQALADVLSKNGSRLHEAVSTLKTIVKLEPDEPDSYIMLGALMLRLNKTAEGKSIFERTFNLFPGSLSLRYDAAEACQMAGDSLCAERLYISILSEDRTQGMAMLKYGVLISEKDNATAEELVKSRSLLRNVIQANSSFVEAFYALASINIRLNMQTEAQDNLHRALTMESSHSGPIKNLAKLYYMNKNYSTAAEVLNLLSVKELGLRENSLYLNILGSSYIELGLFSRALELYRTVVEQGSQNTEAYSTLVKLYKQSRNYKEAKKVLEMARQLNETKSGALFT